MGPEGESRIVRARDEGCCGLALGQSAGFGGKSRMGLCDVRLEGFGFGLEAACTFFEPGLNRLAIEGHFDHRIKRTDVRAPEKGDSNRA